MTKPGRPSAASLAVVAPKPVAQFAESQHLREAPAHLSADAAAWWRSVVQDYDLEPHHLHLLQAAAEAWDRMQQARRSLADHGSLTFTDSSGNLKAHPAEAIERNARTAFARLVRELDLDAGAPAERSRPPALQSNRRSSHAG
ncbi:P27 family predicted phage terminase small subunit [Sphingomonas sp. F9_3S_D5_B_2]